ncbi:MAG TPA: glycoside hydrolase family 25 protein [Candidatus Krumholzibacteria bacterium]
MLNAIDVSHHNMPSKLDWAGMRKAGLDLCIVRLTYGTMKDRAAKEHVRLARDNGCAIGAYHFARFVEPAMEQCVAFWEAAEAVGYGRPEDMIPALDVEDDTASRPIGPEHAPFFEECAGLFKNWRSQGAYIYITQRDWGRIGKPAWVLEMPLWVAHYSAPSRLEPATPNGMPWAIWQHRVGPFMVDGPSGYDKERPLLDQNRVRKLHFFNGEDMTFEDERDEEFRMPPDEDGTEELRGERLDAWIRAEATEPAITSSHDLLRAARDQQMRAELDTLDEEPESDRDPEGNNA